MGQVYVVTSGKGGIGKTHTVFNHGIQLSSLGNKVVLVDADIFMPKLYKVAGLEGEVKAIEEIMDINGQKNNLEYLLKESSLLQNAIIEHSEYKNLSFIPAHILGRGGKNFRDLMRELICCLKERFDYILIDSPSGMEEDFLDAASADDRDLIIASHQVKHVGDGHQERPCTGRFMRPGSSIMIDHLMSGGKLWA